MPEQYSEEKSFLRRYIGLVINGALALCFVALIGNVAYTHCTDRVETVKITEVSARTVVYDVDGVKQPKTNNGRLIYTGNHRTFKSEGTIWLPDHKVWTRLKVGSTCRVMYYGWRSELLHLYPNITQVISCEKTS